MYVLQMASEAHSGPGKHNALRELVVGLPHPDAVNALLSGKAPRSTPISASPPFHQRGAEGRQVHKSSAAIDVFKGRVRRSWCCAPQASPSATSRSPRPSSRRWAIAFALIKNEKNPRKAAEIYLEVEKSSFSTSRRSRRCCATRTTASVWRLRPDDLRRLQHRQGEIKAMPTSGRTCSCPTPRPAGLDPHDRASRTLALDALHPRPPALLPGAIRRQPAWSTRTEKICQLTGEVDASAAPTSSTEPRHRVGLRAPTRGRRWFRPTRRAGAARDIVNAVGGAAFSTRVVDIAARRSAVVTRARYPTHCYAIAVAVLLAHTSAASSRARDERCVLILASVLW